METEIPFFKNMEKQCAYEFDYEVNSIKLDESKELNCKMYYLDKSKKYSKLLYSSKILNFVYLKELSTITVSGIH